MGVCAVNNRTHEVHPPKNQEGTGKILPSVNLEMPSSAQVGTFPPQRWQGRWAMKTICLTAQQRHEIDERRRQAQDRRIDQRLSAVLWSDAGRTREEIAELSGVSTRQVGQWLRIFRNKGPDALCTLHYRGDPGRLRPAQVERLEQEIAKGGFHNADQVRDWIEGQFGVSYSPSGVKDLLHRIGASYHEVTGFFLEGGPGRAA